MSAGFGSIQGTEGPDAGVPIPIPPEDQTQRIIDDLDRIADKYVNGQTNLKLSVAFAANGGDTRQMLGQRVNSILLTVTSGLVFGYLSDASSNFGKAAFPPDFCVSAGVVPVTVQIMIPPREDYTISFQEGSGSAACLGVARLMYI